MKMVILGASRGTGAEATRIALDHGHDVTAFARSPDKLSLSNARLTKLKGNFHNPESVDAAIRGQDAVIITASATGMQGFKENPTYFSQGTTYVIDAMKKHGVRRLVVLSALGVGESKKVAGFLVTGLLIPLLLKLPFADHDRQERLARESGLDWVIVRPGRLTNGPARQKYVMKTELTTVPSSIARADVADFLVKAAESDAWVTKAVQIGG